MNLRQYFIHICFILMLVSGVLSSCRTSVCGLQTVKARYKASAVSGKCNEGNKDCMGANVLVAQNRLPFISISPVKDTSAIYTKLTRNTNSHPVRTSHNYCIKAHRYQNVTRHDTDRSERKHANKSGCNTLFGMTNTHTEEGRALNLFIVGALICPLLLIVSYYMAQSAYERLKREKGDPDRIRLARTVMTACKVAGLFYVILDLLLLLFWYLLLTGLLIGP